MCRYRVWLLLVITCSFGLCLTTKPIEELVVKDNGNGFTSFHFNFVSKTPEFSSSKPHYEFLPRQISELINRYSVNELHLSISKGVWGEEWGSNFEAISPSGAELWVWFKKDTSNVDRAWFEVTHALSGLFCASLNQLSTPQHFTRPLWSYRPSGLTELSNNQIFGDIRYGQLPGEALCSENITPWAKFLPCKRLSGLGSLLLPTALFKANYNSLSIGVRRVCMDETCRDTGLEFSQRLTMVFDRRFIYGNVKLPWSIPSMLGLNYEIDCEAVASSRLTLLNSSTHAVSVETTSAVKQLSVINNTDPRILITIATNELPKSKQTSLSNLLKFKSVDDDNVGSDTVGSFRPQLPLISATKYVTGSGNIRGGVKVLLTSRADFPIKFICFDVIPWYTKVFFSSLKIHSYDPLTQHRIQINPERLEIIPSLARQRLGSLELVLTLPAKHQLIITYQFRKALQRWDEFPPDANHGFYLPSAVISYQLTKEQLNQVKQSKDLHYQDLVLPAWASTYQQLFNHSAANRDEIKRGDGFVRLHTPVSLVSMPTPDFTMPFNVLCLVCSLVSIVFGSLHKATTSIVIAKQSSISAADKQNKIQLLIANIKSLLWMKSHRIRNLSGGGDGHEKMD